MHIDIREIHQLKPASFWILEATDFSFQVTAVDEDVLVVKLKGQASQDGVSVFLDVMQWFKNCLKQHYFTGEYQMVLDCLELTFATVDARQLLVTAFRHKQFLRRVWCFATNRWTLSFWRTLQFLITDTELYLVDNYQEAILNTKKYRTNRSENILKEKDNSTFDIIWQKELKTCSADGYLLKFVDFPDWEFQVSSPFSKAHFKWVSSNVLLVDVQGKMTYPFAAQVLEKEIEIVVYLQSQGVKQVNIVINAQHVSRVELRCLPLFRQHHRFLNIPVKRYITGISPFGRFRMGFFIRRLAARMGMEMFTPSLAFALKRALTSSDSSKTRNQTNKDDSHQLLLNAQRNIYINDEKFRRLLFSHLSMLIAQEQQGEFEFKSSDNYLANEIFHALELIAADFNETYKKLEIDNHALKTLKGQSLQQQINPHFIFNVLNSILGTLYEQKYGEAENLLTNFAVLMRNVIENSQKEVVNLNSELEFLEKYLELEQIRTNNSLSCNLIVSPELQTQAFEISIPPMLLQPFIEVAIWHRLVPNGKGGILSIQFDSDETYVRCVIDDNGVSIQEAIEMRKGHRDPSGLKNVLEQISMLNAVRDIPIHTEELEITIHKALTRRIIQLPITLEKHGRE